MLATLLDSDPFLGRCLIGKVERGFAVVNSNVQAINLKEKIKLKIINLIKFLNIIYIFL